MVKIVYKLLRFLEKTDFYCDILNKVMGSNLEKLNEEEAKKFIFWFLNQEYKKEDKMLIFHFLDVTRDKINTEEIEEALVDSVYFESMPQNIIMDFLSNRRSVFLNKSSIFKTYLTSKITRARTLINLIGMNAYLDYDYAYRRLASESDIDELTSYERFKGIRGNAQFARAIFQNDDFDLEDIKHFFSYTKTYVDALTDCYALVYLRSEEDKEKDEVIASLVEVMESFDEANDGNIIERKSKKAEDVIYGISESKLWTDEMKIRFVKRLLALKNLEFIDYWFIYDIECSYNYDLIDAVLEESDYAVIDLLLVLNDNYFQYASAKVLDKGKDYLHNLVEVMATEKSLEEIVGVDRLLDFLYYVDYEYKISREAAFNLLLAGSECAPKYLSEFHWSNEEREQILKVYSVMQPIYLRFFEEYLKTGNPLKLPDKNETLRILKKTFKN